MIIEYKNMRMVKATFRNVDAMDIKDEHVILRRVQRYANTTAGQPTPASVPVRLTDYTYDWWTTVAILRLGQGEYVEVVNELAGT
jgi:hypothetical protein